MWPEQDTQGGPPARPRRPTQEQLTYLKTVLELALLALAVPWLLFRLFTNPGRTFRDAGEHHLG